MAEGVNPGWILSGLRSRGATTSTPLDTPQMLMGFPQVGTSCGNGMEASTLSSPISRENLLGSARLLPGLSSAEYLSVSDPPEMTPNKGLTSTPLPKIQPLDQSPCCWKASP